MQTLNDFVIYTLIILVALVIMSLSHKDKAVEDVSKPHSEEALCILYVWVCFSPFSVHCPCPISPYPALLPGQISA